MRLAVASEGAGLTDAVSDRFGRAPYLLFIDSRTLECEAVSNLANRTALELSGLAAVELIREREAGAVLAGRMGRRAFAALEQASIGSYVATGMTVAAAVAAYGRGRLKPFRSDELLAPPLQPWCAPPAPACGDLAGETS
jgi:predicted Fe-Mo cluster-binding NifX family protein